MELLNIFSAIPKVALFLLVIVSGAIVAEIFYFRRRKEIKPPEVSIPVFTPPPSAPPPPSPIEAKAVTGPPPAPTVENLEVTPMPTPQAGFTTEVVPAKKSPLSKKTLTMLLVLLLVTVSIPAAILLVRQRQELRKLAYPGQNCTTKDDCNGLYEECINGKCVDTNVVTNCGDKVCNGSETCSSCPGDCGSCGQCLPDGAVCNGPGQTNESCCSVICNFGTCRGNTPAEGCGGLDEPTCWTHGVYCYWLNGECVPNAGVTPTPGTGTIECQAGSGGVKIINKTNQTISGGVSWFASRCGDTVNCMCGGQSSSENVTLAPGQSWSKGMGGSGCAWQADVAGLASCANSGCDNCQETPPPGTTPPTTTPPTFLAQCVATGTFDTDFNAITDLTTLKVGQTVVFGTHGSTTDPGGITMARFRINGTADASWCSGTGNTIVGGWCQTTNIHGANFFVQFTVPNNGPFNVSSMVFNPTLGWH